MVRSILSLAAAATLACVHGAVIDHDTVPVWPQPTAADATQKLALRFKPYLNVVNGCQPYPAVTPTGDVSGGLKPSGGSSANCNDKGKAQIYSRSGTYNGYYAIMYAWYMPKDEPSTGIGHRHDWENAIVWLDNAASANIVALSASAHSGYKTSYPPDATYLNGISAKISYKSTWPLDHELGFTTVAGAQQPLTQWEQMTPAAQNALETTDFGSADVPFKSNFQDKLAKGFFK
nr:necrosis-inducing protein NPP1 domain-containing protein [Pythium myriotylum]